MTEDLVTRIRDVFADTPEVMTWFTEDTYAAAETRAHISGMWDTLKKAADRIEELERAVLDLAQYISRADLCFYVEPKTRKILNTIEEKTND